SSQFARLAGRSMAQSPMPRRRRRPTRQNHLRMATELLYLSDAYLRSFTARVVEVDAEGNRVALDQTAFYPTGGGQPHDNGTLSGRGVVDVRKEGECVWHTLEGDLPSAGEEVQGEVDWERR